MMQKVAIAVAVALTVSGFGVLAQQSDPIRQRQDLMKSNQEQLRLLTGMSRGQIPFDAGRAQTALQAVEQNAKRIPTLFPEDSQKGKTNALPVIWERKADFEARAAKLEQDARSAQTGITDPASVQAALQRVGQNCGGCHETYRKKET
jgi:cytochrome c556